MRTFCWWMASLVVGLTVLILLLARWAYGYVAALPLVGLIIYACFAPHSEAVRAEWMIAGVFGGAFALGLGSEIFRDWAPGWVEKRLRASAERDKLYRAMRQDAKEAKRDQEEDESFFDPREPGPGGTGPAVVFKLFQEQ